MTRCVVWGTLPAPPCAPRPTVRGGGGVPMVLPYRGPTVDPISSPERSRPWRLEGGVRLL